MEINVFCLFGKMVKLHLLVSPYRCVPSVAVTRITAVDFHWRWREPRRRLRRGCRKRLGHGVEGRYGGCLVQLHNNIQEFTDCEQSPFSPALTGEALKNAEHWNWLPTVSVDNSLEEMLFQPRGENPSFVFGFYHRLQGIGQCSSTLGEGSTLPNPPIQMLISSRNTLKDTPRNNV